MRRLTCFLVMAALSGCQCGGPTPAADTVVLAPLQTPIDADVTFDGAGQAVITVRAGDRPVDIQLAQGAADAQALPTTKTGEATVATVANLPQTGNALVVITRKEADGKETVVLLEWAWMTAPDEAAEFRSPDGQLLLLAQPGQVAAGTRISVLAGVGGGAGGVRELAGPYRLEGAQGTALRGFFEVAGGALAQDTLRVLRFEPDGKRTQVPFVALPDQRVAFDAVLPGTYALVGAREVKP